MWQRLTLPTLKLHLLSIPFPRVPVLSGPRFGCIVIVFYGRDSGGGAGRQAAGRGRGPNNRAPRGPADGTPGYVVFFLS